MNRPQDAMGALVGMAVDDALEHDPDALRFGPRTEREVRTALSLLSGDAAGDLTDEQSIVEALFAKVPIEPRRGIQQIPSRHLTYLNGIVDGVPYRALDLMYLAERLIGGTPVTHEEFQPAKPIGLIRPGVYASNAEGALTAPEDWAVVSLCRVFNRFADREHRREVFLIDAHDANDHLAAVTDDVVAEIDAISATGRPVLVHCWAGESRTAFALRAWLMHHEGLTAEESAAALKQVWPYMHRNNLDFEAELERRDPAPSSG